MNDHENPSWQRIAGAGMLGIIALVLTACGGGGGGGGGVIDPNDEDGVSNALAVKFGGEKAERVAGDPPTRVDGDMGEPEVNLRSANKMVSPGDETVVTADAIPGNSALANLYAKVTGSDDYFNVNLAQQQALTTKQGTQTLDLSFEIPENLGAGEFCVEISVREADDSVSEVAEVCFQNVPEGNDPAAVQAALQGAWERCIGGELERLEIEAATINSMITEFSGGNCTGDELSTEQSTLTYEVGPAFTTAGGLTANELDLFIESSPDNPEEEGQVSLDIVRVTSDQLTFGDGDSAASDGRPTRLNFSGSYQRAEPSVPDDADQQNDPAEVQAALQGTWERCLGGLQRLEIEAATITLTRRFFLNDDCTGQESSPSEQRILTYEIGPAINTFDASNANQIDLFIESAPDNPEEEGQMVLDIVRVTSNGLFFGDGDFVPNRARPDRIFFNERYRRVEPSQPDNGGPATAEGTWSFSVMGAVTRPDGQTEQIPRSDLGEVPGENVPIRAPENAEQINIQFVDSFEAGFEQACDEFTGTTEIAQFTQSRDGDGEVGTIVDLIVDVFVDGTCTQDGQSRPLNLDADLTFTWERIR